MKNMNISNIKALSSSSSITQAKKALVLLLLIVFSLGETYSQIAIIESQSNHPMQDMDDNWNTAAIELGYNTNIFQQSALDDISNFDNYSIVIISSGVINITLSREANIMQMVENGKHFYIQSEWLPTHSGNELFSNLVNNLGGSFNWAGETSGNIVPMQVLEPMASILYFPTSLPYFWYGTYGDGDSSVVPFLEHLNKRYGFIFTPPNSNHGKVITTSDQDWIRININTDLLKNIITSLSQGNPSLCSVSPPPLGWPSSFCQEEMDFSVTTDGFTSPHGFEWNFGDGTITNGSSAISHAYSESGTYQVCVQAANATCTANYCQNITFANSPPIFNNIPANVTLDPTDLTNCWNEEYQPIVTAEDPCDFSFPPSPVSITYTRNDDADINAPWPAGQTITVTATAIGIAGPASVSWNVEILECESGCADEFTPTFSTFYDNENIPTDRNPIIMDALSSSNGEFISIGLRFLVGSGSDLFFQRQDDEGNILTTLLKYNFLESIEYDVLPDFTGFMIREAFIEEAFNSNGVSIGYYIGTTVFYNSPLAMINAHDAVLMLVDHSGNEIWTEHLFLPDTEESVRGLDILPDGTPFLIIDQSSNSSDPHLAIWVQGSSFTLEFPTPSNPNTSYLFNPTCISKISNSQNAEFDYAVGGQFQQNGETYIGIYLFNEIFEYQTTILYKLTPDISQQSIIPTSLISTGDTIIVSGYHELVTNQPKSFIISFVPIGSSPGQYDASTVWAKEYSSTSGVNGEGFHFFDSRLTNNNDIAIAGTSLLSNNIDLPFLLKLNNIGDFKFINNYSESSDSQNFGNGFIPGFDVTNDNGFLLYSSFFETTSSAYKVWTAKVDSEGGLDNCNCFVESTIQVQNLSPEVTIFDYGIVEAPLSTLILPDVITLVDSLNFSACSQDITTPDFCGIPSCDSDTLFLNTGYDPINQSLSPIGSYDNFWTLTTSPTPNLNVPFPASVISPHPAWGSQANSRWISAYPYPNFTMNNPDNVPAPLLPYTFQNCFCTCGDITDVNINLSILADDKVIVSLKDIDDNTIQEFLTHIGHGGTPGVIDQTISLPEGTYCVTAELRNIGGQAMGININGYITGASVIDAVCCNHTNGTIIGTKFRDKNCDGIRNNPNNTNAANHEEGLAGWEISLCDSDLNVIETTTTDPFGLYVFNDVPPGSYIVKETPQVNWEATNTVSENGHQISVGTNEIVSDIDFANKYNGPVELLSNFDCVVPGEEVGIQWDGPDCDCDIVIKTISCGSVSSTQTIATIPTNDGGYTWGVPDDLLFDSYQLLLEACNGTESITSTCFEVIDFDINVEVIDLGCEGEMIFTANANASAQFEWDFGDANTGEGYSVSHSYQTPGTYHVIVTAFSTNQCSQADTIIVSPPDDIIAPICFAEEFISEIGDPALGGAFVDFPLPFAADNCSQNPTIVCTPPSGSFFPCGITEVVCSVTDEAGNTGECILNVEVNCQSPCQSPSFLKLYGDDINNVITKIEEHDNALYALGYRTTADPDISGVFMKLDLDGNIIWKAQLPNSYRMHDFVKTDDGFILVGGTQPFNGASNSLICKINENGTLGWAKEYSFVNRERLTQILPALNPNEFYVFGIIINTPPTVDDQILLTIDANGNELGYKKLDYADDQLNSGFFKLSNGDYIMLGGRGTYAQLGRMNASATAAFYATEGGSNYQLYNGVEANEKIYLVGKDGTNAYILVLNQTGTQRVARYTLPNINAAYRIQADNDGNLYVSGTSNDPNTVGLPLIYKLTESFPSGTTTELAIEWTKGINNYESAYGFANITITSDQKLIYADSRQDAPGSFGGLDAMIGVFDLNMGGECIIDTFTHLISGPTVIAQDITAPFSISEGTFPIPTTFDINTYFNYLCTPIDCTPVPCDSTNSCTEPPVFLYCQPDLNLNTSNSNCDITWPPLLEVYFPCQDTTLSGSYFPNGEIVYERSDSPSNIEDPWMVGVTTVTATATGINGESATCTFTVTVFDATDPIFLDCPEDIFVTADPGETQVAVHFDALPQAIDNCSNVTVDCDFFDDQNWPCGETVATCIATDDSGNTAVCSFTVTVDCGCSAVISGGPTSCDNVFVEANTMGLSAPITYTWSAPGLIENQNAPSTNVSIPSNVLDGQICVTASDANCETIACIDFTMPPNPPEFTSCQDLTFETTIDNCEAFFNCGDLTAVEPCSGVQVPVVCVRSDGADPSAPYPLGPTNITATATNSAGETSTCQFTINVIDNIAPTIVNCPPDITICEEPNGQTIYDFNLPTFADNCDPNTALTITCDPPSGSVFPLGMTTVSCTATDQFGNTSLPCTFVVTVEPCPIDDCCDDPIGFCNRFDEGFTIGKQECELFITPLGLDSCDNVTIYWGDGTLSQAMGGDSLSHNYNINNSADYGITYIVNNYAADGTVCQSKDSTLIVCIECEACDNASFGKIWTKGFGDYVASGNQENKFGLAVSGSDYYVSGGFNNTTDFGDGNVFTSQGNKDIFFGKYSDDGTISEMYTAGGDLEDIATEIVVDNAGNIYIGGWFRSESITLPTSSGTPILLPNTYLDDLGTQDIFIAKYSPAFELLWAKSFGTNQDDQLFDMDVDASGAVAITGSYSSYQFSFDGNMTLLPLPYRIGGFVAKFDTDGNPLWNFGISSNSSSADWDALASAAGIDFDDEGNVYVTGGFSGPTNMNPLGTAMEYNSCDADCDNLYLAKYNSSNGHLQWLVDVSPNGLGSIHPHGIEVADGKIYVTGQMSIPDPVNFAPNGITSGSTWTDFDLVNGSINLNGFLAKYDTEGGSCDWAFGMDLNGKSYDVDVDNDGNVSIVGFYHREGNLTIFDPAPDATFVLNSYGQDGFISKYTTEGEFITAFAITGTGANKLHEVVSDNDNNLVVIGHYNSSELDDDPAPDNTQFLSSDEFGELFIGKYDCSCSAMDVECCDKLSATIEETTDPEDCCYNISLQNDLGLSIVSAQLNLNTDDWVINQAALADGYEISNATDDRLLIEHQSGALPDGLLEDVITVCLDSELSNSPDEQELELLWYTTGDPSDGRLRIQCRDTLTTFDCDIEGDSCMNVTITDPPICMSGSYNEYSFNISVTNESMVDANVMVMNNSNPGFTLAPCFIPSQYATQHFTYSFPNGLAPGETADSLCFKVITTEHLFENTEFCFTTTLEGAGSQSCCTDATEICVTIEPCCDPCEAAEIISEPWPDSEDCCYEVDISNACYPDFFTKIEMEVLTEGVIFDNIQTGNQLEWDFEFTNNQSVFWYPELAYIPRGLSENMIQFCLNGIEDNSQMPQEVLFKWYGEDPDSPTGEEIVFCVDTLTYECAISDTLDCLQVEYNSIECLELDSLYELTFTITNNSMPEFDFAQINLNSTQGVTVIGSPIILLSSELPAGQSEQFTVLLYYRPFPFPLPTFDFEVAVKDIASGACCNEFQNLSVPVPNPCIVSTSELMNQENLWIFPNPFEQFFTILFERPTDQTIQLQIRDIYGRALHTEKVSTGSKFLKIQTDDFASGVYFLEFKDSDGNVAVRKVIKI